MQGGRQTAFPNAKVNIFVHVLLSSPSQRGISTAGKAVMPPRSLLKPEKVNLLLFLCQTIYILALKLCAAFVLKGRLYKYGERKHRL